MNVILSEIQKVRSCKTSTATDIEFIKQKAPDRG